ncbi:hypothetical protein AAC387_Pa05g0807 [Persea americana]
MSSPTPPSVNETSNSPYYLHHSDNPGTILVSTPLTGDNYPTWKRAMRMALCAKNKMGLVDGPLPKPISPPADIQAWEHCNFMVLSWILNVLSKTLADSVIYAETVHGVWKELEDRFSRSNAPRIYHLKRSITMIQQGIQSLAEYFTRLKVLWDELASYTVIRDCTCGAHKNCTCDAHKNCTCDAHKAVSAALQSEKDEQQREFTPTVTHDGVAFASDRTAQNQRSSAYNGQSSNRSSGGRGQGRSRGRPFCDHCNVHGHTRQTCWPLNGYPPGFQGVGAVKARGVLLQMSFSTSSSELKLLPKLM